MVRIKKLFSLSLLFSLVAASSLSAMEVEREVSPFHEIDSMDLSEATFCIPQERVRSKGNKKLFYNKKGFFVADGADVKPVHSYDTDQLLRGRKVNDIVKYGALGKFQIGEFDNGEYSITAVGEIKGGGVVGAWLGSTLGYGLVTFAGHGTTFLISCLAGPAQPVAWATLSKMAAIPIHTAACAAGVAGGVAAGVATGPL